MNPAPPASLSPLEYATGVNAVMVSCTAAPRNFAIATPEGFLVFVPAGSTWLPEKLAAHRYVAAQGITLT
jgi:hypothetical protein